MEIEVSFNMGTDNPRILFPDDWFREISRFMAREAKLSLNMIEVRDWIVSQELATDLLKAGPTEPFCWNFFGTMFDSLVPDEERSEVWPDDCFDEKMEVAGDEVIRVFQRHAYNQGYRLLPSTDKAPQRSEEPDSEL